MYTQSTRSVPLTRYTAQHPTLVSGSQLLSLEITCGNFPARVSFMQMVSLEVWGEGRAGAFILQISYCLCN